MSNHKTPGSRVGAISHSDDNAVYLFGFGTYEGDFVPVGAGGAFGKAMQDAEAPNPKIVLDSGKVVWGCECWWAPEEKVKKLIEGKAVVDVDIEAVRASLQEGTDLIPVTIPEDPELTSIVDSAEKQFPTLEAVKHDIEKLLKKYIGVKVGLTFVTTVSQDLLLELVAMQTQGIIMGVTLFSVDIDGDELEVNLGIRFPNGFVVGLTFTVGPVLKKSDFLDTERI